jgi:putative serine protease PepD
METPRRPGWSIRRLAVLAVAVAVGAVAGAGAFALSSGNSDTTSAPSAASAQPAALVAATSLTIGEIYERSAAGVVDIAVSGAGGGFSQTQGEGSGFVLDKDGHIVTNAHVVDGADAITVTFSNGKQAQATLVGEDASSDVAVIKVDVPTEELTPLPLGSSANVKVGDAVVAIGSPFGYEGTVTTGIVSALDRSVDAPNGYPITGAIQTDAAINPGNSGGPLLDSAGNVIGVNAQIASNSGGNDGVGFAIPIDVVKQVASQLVAGESVQHAYLGVSLATVDASAAQALGLPEGAQVAAVQEGSPASAAGLQAGSATETINGQPYSTDGDVITAVDGTPITSADELVAAIAAKQPGDQVTLAVSRNGETLTVDVTLGTRPS